MIPFDEIIVFQMGFKIKKTKWTKLGGGFKHVLFSSLFGEDSYFD